MLVDSNVLIDVFVDDPQWADWSISQLKAQSKISLLTVNPIIYSELSLTFSSVESLDQALDELNVMVWELPKEALFLAGKAYLEYRRKGGTKSNVLPDFFIGAHAAVNGVKIITRDIRRYASYFPTVELISPSRPIKD